MSAKGDIYTVSEELIILLGPGDLNCIKFIVSIEKMAAKSFSFAYKRTFQTNKQTNKQRTKPIRVTSLEASLPSLPFSFSSLSPPFFPSSPSLPFASPLLFLPAPSIRERPSCWIALSTLFRKKTLIHWKTFGTWKRGPFYCSSSQRSRHCKLRHFCRVSKDIRHDEDQRSRRRAFLRFLPLFVMIQAKCKLSR